ncbi:MAG: hypothetical protein ACK5ZG_13170 [Phycisphaerae bacterium]
MSPCWRSTQCSNPRERASVIVNNVKDVASMIQNIALAAERLGSESEQINPS